VSPVACRKSAAKSEKELARLSAMPLASPEVSVVRNYLDWLLELPWQTQITDNLDIARAAQILSRNHYGYRRSKNVFWSHIAVRKLAPDKMRSPILCLWDRGNRQDQPGQILFAEALGRKFVR